jgi:hypothetical protein
MRFQTAIALSLLLVAAPAAWGDTITSSASSLASKSVGASSDSISGSSKSSSGGDQKVAAGPYEVVQLADAQGKPGQQRLTLRATEATAAFNLDLPADTARTAGVGVGQTVLVQDRPYGYAFALAQAPQQPFYLVVHRAWEGELRSQAVK